MDGDRRIPPLRCLPAVGMIAYAEDAGTALRGWRDLHDISQTALADYMGVSPSVISDYENGRRENPGVAFVAEYVEAVVALEEGREPPPDEDEADPSPDPFGTDTEEWESLPPGLPDGIKESVRAAWEGFEDA